MGHDLQVDDNLKPVPTKVTYRELFTRDFTNITRTSVKKCYMIAQTVWLYHLMDLFVATISVATTCCYYLLLYKSTTSNCAGSYRRWNW